MSWPSQTSNLDAQELRLRVGDIIRLRMSGGIDDMLQYFSQNILLHYTCAKGGKYEPMLRWGREAFRDNIRRTDETFQALSYEILDILVDGQRTVVRWRSDWRHHGSREEWTIDMAHFLTWRDGQVSELYEFLDLHCEWAPRGAATLPAGLNTLMTLQTPRPSGLARDEMERRAFALIGEMSKHPDESAIEELCARDIVCEFGGRRSYIPYAGRHVGVEALIGIVKFIATDFTQGPCPIFEVFSEDSRVAVRRRVYWSHVGTGRSNYVDLATFIRFDDGKIVELVECRDSPTLLAMQGEL